MQYYLVNLIGLFISMAKSLSINGFNALSPKNSLNFVPWAWPIPKASCIPLPEKTAAPSLFKDISK